MPSARLGNVKAAVDLSLDVPEGFTASDRLSPGVGYPRDLGGICNVPLPTAEDGNEDGFPRIDLLPAKGVMLWAVVFDSRFEDDPYAPGVRDGAQVSGLAPMGGGDELPSPWDNVRVWTRIFELSHAKTCQVFAFAGTSPRAPMGSLASAMRSMRWDG